MALRVRVVLGMILLVVGGCAGELSPAEERERTKKKMFQDDLDEARGRWNAAKVEKYVYTYEGTWDGAAPDWPGRIEIEAEATVAAGRVLGIEQPEHYEESGYAEPMAYFTDNGSSIGGNSIEALLDAIEWNIDNDQAVDVVRYDEDLGYPTAFSQDYVELGHDAYFFSIGCLEVAPYDDDACSTFDGAPLSSEDDGGLE